MCIRDRLFGNGTHGLILFELLDFEGYAEGNNLLFEAERIASKLLYLVGEGKNFTICSFFGGRCTKREEACKQALGARFSVIDSDRDGAPHQAANALRAEAYGSKLPLTHRPKYRS